MANEDFVSSIMTNLRELHPELPERARVNLELDLRRMESAPTTDVKDAATADWPMSRDQHGGRARVA